MNDDKNPIIMEEVDKVVLELRQVVFNDTLDIYGKHLRALSDKYSDQLSGTILLNAVSIYTCLLFLPLVKGIVKDKREEFVGSASQLIRDNLLKALELDDE